MKIFIDCGHHQGQGLREFTRRLGIDNRWRIHCFEPNSASLGRMVDAPMRVNHAQAVWVSDGTALFYQEKAHGGELNGQGSTMLPGFGFKSGKKAAFAPEISDAPIEVKTIDFLRFLRETTCPHDEIYIKMDIEGAEFTVLRLMLKHPRVFANIKFMAVEFHERFVDGETQETEDELLARLGELTEAARHW